MIHVTEDYDQVLKGEKFDSGFGGEKANEEEEDDYAAETETGFAIVLNANLQEFDFDLKSYKVCLKDYLKRVKTHLDENNPDRY